MFNNLFGGFGDNNNMFLILIALFLFGGFGDDGCGSGCGSGDNWIWIILLFFLLGDTGGVCLQK